MATKPSRGAATISLPADEQILITREFEAPPHLLYRAWTTPDLVTRWWAGTRGSMTSVEIDLRVGGRWRYVMVGADGDELAFHGEYREIVPDERLVFTEVLEIPGLPSSDEGAPVNTVGFSGQAGATTFTQLVDCPDRDLRDAILESGMELAVQDQLARLAELARSFD